MLRVLRITGALPIYEQLLIEEGLLRASSDNWLVLSKSPAHQKSIVMGLSSVNAKKLPNLIHAKNCHDDNVPVIKRFSGGGTVYIDRETLFVSVIFNSNVLPEGVDAYPKPLMKWTANSIYSRAFKAMEERIGKNLRDGFILNENDYCVGSKKFGGNAQSLVKDRFLHHTSILWDVDTSAMGKYLKLPPKDMLPEYRRERNHDDFVIPLKQVFGNEASGDHFLDSILEAVNCSDFQESSGFKGVEFVELQDVQLYLHAKEFRKSTEIVDLAPFLHL
jgi:lipoate-protein ligase A